MPLDVRDRLWESPGPAQSGPGAPRLLIVYPETGMEPYGGAALRYMGRVEPEDAAVTLNGDAVRVWPGGLFSGVRPIRGRGAAEWKFRASRGGRATVVTRTIPIRPPTPPAPAWPLAFYASPVRPAGSYWIPAGETLPVTLYASSGHRAQARIGQGGPWLDMAPAGDDPRRGGVYRIDLSPPPLRPNELAPVYFRLSGSRGGQERTIELPSSLRVGSEPDEEFFVARVGAEFASFLKEPTGWVRWGNIVQGTYAPFFEIRGDRLFMDFDHGQRGWLELSALDMPAAPRDFLLPQLRGGLNFESDRQTLRLSMPGQADPVAFVFEEQSENPARIRLTLTGASTLIVPPPAAAYGTFSVDQWTSGSRGEAPALELTSTRPLWGFGSEIQPNGEFSLFVRSAPALSGATPAQPLRGLRIMVDAGHGGRDPGAFGASGIAEADVNLVAAAWLERSLADLGAEVLQVRRGDEYVGLDSRVNDALDYDPDLFISVHHNSVGSAEDPTADSGPIVFYHYEHSRPLGEAVEARLVEAFGAGREARVTPQNFRVNRNISPCPSILIEGGYLCNPADEAKLRDTAWIRKSAEAVARGVADYVGTMR
ncbi:MAG: N-acetylmuramoyl-L-alanine amidase [Candidatus Sumerlaeia bacterium]